MTVPTNIKFNLNAPFPSLVTGTGPITIGKQNGIWTVGFNTANLAVQNPPQPSALATDYVLVYDSVAKQYINVPLSNFTTFTLLNVMTANNSGALDDTTSITAAFQDYIVAFENVLPVTDAVHLSMRVRTAGVFQTTNYLNSAGGVTGYIDLTQAANLSNSAGWGYSGSIRIFNANNAVSGKPISGVGSYLNSALGVSATTVGGTLSSAAAITGLRFLMSAGNIASGSIKIYGSI